MNFGEAIELVKEGRMIQRTGWNGKGLFVFMQIPANIDVKTIVPTMQSLPQSVKDEFKRRLELDNESTEGKAVLYYSITYINQLALVDSLNLITGWSPSVSDALAEDWVLYV